MNRINQYIISVLSAFSLLNAGDKEHDTALVKCYAPIEEKIETTAPEAIDPEADSETDAPKDGETAKEEASKDDAADSKKD